MRPAAPWVVLAVLCGVNVALQALVWFSFAGDAMGWGEDRRAAFLTLMARGAWMAVAGVGVALVALGCRCYLARRMAQAIDEMGTVALVLVERGMRPPAPGPRAAGRVAPMAGG